MAGSPQSVHRWTASVYLGIAILMVIAGTTVLDNRLTGMTFIAYWLTCAALTFLTLLIALLDFRTVRQNSRQEQTELIRDVLAAINETKNKSPGDSEPEEPQQ